MKKKKKSSLHAASDLFILFYFLFLPQILAAQFQLSTKSNLHLPPPPSLKVLSKLLLNM